MAVGESPPLGTDPLLEQLVAERYRVLRKLGEGGMGAVYLAEHVVIEKKLVLKVLAPELSRRKDLGARFLQEARSASRIGHENVIDISDFGQSADGFVYIAMEYLEGKDLGEVVRAEGALAWVRVRDILVQICRALRAAHDKGIVHRDMKPENIFLIQREGQPEFVKILDFGIAKVMGLDANGPRLTRTGMIFGTPEYMAPEQAEGKEADHRVDVYAVGCIAYHLLTGNTPFMAENFMAMLTKHLMEDPVAPSVRRPDLEITPEMDAVVLKALEKDRDKRYQNMAEFFDAISTCIGPDPSSPRRAAVGLTREMGGAHSKATLKIEQPEDRASDTELVPRGWEEAAASEPRVQRARSAPGVLVLVAVGLVLGTAGALWFALSRGKETARQPEAPVEARQPQPISPLPPNAPVAAPAAPESVPAPVPEPKLAPAPVIPPPVAAVVPAAPSEAQPAERSGKHGRSPVRKIKGSTPAASPSPASKIDKAPVAPAPMAPATPKPPPAGLKPFPGM